MSTDLQALLERVEGASGPDRELDARLWCWSTGTEFIKIADGSEAYGDLCREGEHGYGWKSKVVRGALVLRHSEPQDRGNQTQCWSNWPPASHAYTASVDAALALVERVLGPKFWMFCRGRVSEGEPLFGFVIYDVETVAAFDWNPDDHEIARAEHNDRCLCVIAALLKALLAQREGK